MDGDDNDKENNKPYKSSKPDPFTNGVPEIPQRCSVASVETISAAFAVDDSTICASSKHIRHHLIDTNGEGIAGYFFLCLDRRLIIFACDNSFLNTPYVVNMMSYFSN